MTPAPTTIFIADDHPIFRKGLEEVIMFDNQFQVIGNAGDGETALEEIQHLLPNVAVIDIEMPKLNGLEVIRRIHEASLPVYCIVLTMYREEAIFDQALDLGVRGYLLKDSAIADILKGIETVSRGQYFISPSLTSRALETHPAVNQTIHQRLGVDKLTATERQIISLIAQSLSTKEIADSLNVSPRTVENHRYNIVRKLGLSGNYSLLRFALDNKAYLA